MASVRTSAPLFSTSQRNLKRAGPLPSINPLKIHDFKSTTRGQRAQQSVQKTLASKHMPTAALPTSFPEKRTTLGLIFQRQCNLYPFCLRMTTKTSPAPNPNNLTKSSQATTGIKATLPRRWDSMSLQTATRSPPSMRRIDTWILKWPTNQPTPAVQRRCRAAATITLHQTHHIPRPRDMTTTQPHPLPAEEVVLCQDLHLRPTRPRLNSKKIHSRFQLAGKWGRE